MTLHVPQPSLNNALARVIALAEQIDAAGLNAEERANVAVSYLIESSTDIWPLAMQRQILAEATKALDAGMVPVTQGTSSKGDRGASLPQAPSASVEPLPTKETEPSLPPVDGSMGILTLANELIHDLTEILDFSELAGQNRTEQEATIRASIHSVSEKRKLHLNGKEISDLIGAVLADMLGLGPLEVLLADESVTDIMVNGPTQVFVERHGKLELTPVKFRDNAHVYAVASRIVAAVGRRIDESQPMVDARLKDGSRVNVAVPPLAIDGPTITIRKFPSAPVKLDRLVEGGSLSNQMAAFLALAAYLRLNILVSGGTGSGKTTLLNAMSQYISPSERIVTIEDAAELRFQQPHIVRFETRPPNVEGTGEVTMRTLVRNALRMRPDRIIIGEIRGDEVLDLMQAMNTGHDGSMSTLHANSPREALTRVESMAALAGFAPGGAVVRRQLVDAVHLIVQVSRMRDGKRRITSISEIAGIAGDAVTLQELFSFRADPASTRAEVRGDFVYSGYRPKFASRAADYGVEDELNGILGG
ncbi:CpaF family protein [Flavimaricola marinus]|uniref:Putative conjugal transfer protein/MT3759 n=1 Tax=Flavimaricola marinus TaxID=1819565 RepID=A0A238LHP6_9RHOB|nr:CpaF family protein [Flavimaricola marinus]SMY08924.1 Putative conjugal transfer protein/MT3759 [Flavimaricola marinus]